MITTNFISKELCEKCPHIDIKAQTVLTTVKGVTTSHTGIFCKNEDKCRTLLAYLASKTDP